jgi:selenocysteine-specific elongation factor
VEFASAGTRVAVNLVGIPTEAIERGDVLTTPGWLKPSRVVDVRLRMVADAERPLVHNAAVTFHTGAAEALGKVGLLDANELTNGQSSWAQIRLDRPLAVVRGDLYVLRLPSPSITIAGGAIVDEHPKRHRRFQPRVLEQLGVLEQGSPEDVLLQTLQTREPAEVSELAKRAALAPDEARTLVSRLLADEMILDLSAGADENAAGGAVLKPTSLVISTPGWAGIVTAVESDLTRYHAAHHLRRGMSKEELREHLSLEPRVFAAVERSLRERGHIAEDGPFVHRPGFRPVLSDEEERGARRASWICSARETCRHPPPRSSLPAPVPPRSCSRR